MVGVRLQVLDAEQRPISGLVASGFIRRLQGSLFLYTCWHVVTGFDPNAVRVSSSLPIRRHLAVALQAAEQRNPGMQVIGGLQELNVPLYDESVNPPMPLWEQDDQHIPNIELNAVNIFLPFWHDVVRIELPPELSLSSMQLVDEERLFQGNSPLVAPGDKCLIVGYPYGFSAFGPEQPTPVALTRFVASDRIGGRRQQFLLEGIGAPGMSGGPVFIERDQELLLLGVYTGSIYPDHVVHSYEKVTALGTVANISMLLWESLPFVRHPSEPVPSGSSLKKLPSSD